MTANVWLLGRAIHVKSYETIGVWALAAPASANTMQAAARFDVVMDQLRETPGSVPLASRWASEMCFYGQPAANRLRKHGKSLTFSAGSPIGPAQLAYALPAAKALTKHWKSTMLRAGGVVEASQLA